MPSSGANVVDLAQLLIDRAADLHHAERLVDRLVESLFPGWRPRFPMRLGWRFTEPGTLDVFGVAESAVARGALGMAGFSVVVLHDHSALGHTQCSCGERGVVS